jgi:pyruvate ferredoxin oxidoreductase gamma subunit
LLKVRFHGRGGQGAKVASRILGTAAFYEGYNAQDFPLYGAERRGAPIAAFTRISRETILERGVISEPDVVIVLDETLLDDPRAAPLAGLGEGIVFINTTRSPEEIKKRYGTAAEVVTLDITKVGLDMLERPVLSTLAAAVASRLAGISEESLTKAVKKELAGIIAEEALLDKNINAARHCFNAVREVELKPARGGLKASPVTAVPFEAAVVSSPAVNATANTPERKTGNWRIFKPVWDHDVCSKCMLCVTNCPEGCIHVNEDGFPYADYDNCKGCLICSEGCPTGAIDVEREFHPE